MNENNKLYPLLFKPLLKEIIWGGYDICPFKGLESNENKIGESWEISHVPGNYSIVSNGVLQGKTIDDLIKDYGSILVGKSVIERFGNTFPLLIKFIDARDNLSIQVHPNDELAQKRHNSFGKTEMWYVVKATDEAKLYSGFKVQSSPSDYVKRIKDNTIMEALSQYQVKEGDVFFLPAGRVHAIGAGCFVAEIQQTSNITYRIYDYNRKDANGNTRELHTEQAKDAINYEIKDDYRTKYSSQLNKPTELVNSQYFKTNLIEITDTINRDFSDLDSFVIYMCLSGSITLVDDLENKLTIKQGTSVLIPACTNNIKLIPDKYAKLLETYIP